MTALELQAKKAMLAKRLLNIDNEEIIEKISGIFDELTSNMPCQYSAKEVIESSQEAEKAFDAGQMNKFVTLESLEGRYLR